MIPRCKPASSSVWPAPDDYRNERPVQIEEKLPDHCKHAPDGGSVNIELYSHTYNGHYWDPKELVSSGAFPSGDAGKIGRQSFVAAAVDKYMKPKNEGGMGWENPMGPRWE